MRIATLLALIAGAFLLTSATPEPAHAFKFCSGLKPIKPHELNWPPDCTEMCMQGRLQRLSPSPGSVSFPSRPTR